MILKCPLTVNSVHCMNKLSVVEAVHGFIVWLRNKGETKEQTHIKCQ